MTLTALSRGEHLEPPPWLYARLARGSLMRLIYRRLIPIWRGACPREPASWMWAPAPAISWAIWPGSGPTSASGAWISRPT